MISIKIKSKLTELEPCEMCKSSFNGNVNYEYHSSFSNTILQICKKCAIREYYGTNHSKSKKWKKYKKDGKLFK